MLSAKSSLAILFLTLAASLVDTRATSRFLNETDHLLNETDHHHEDENDHILNETDHHNEEEELTQTEILALEAKCTCIEGALYCSDAEGLEHCDCEGGEAHCEGHDEEHNKEHHEAEHSEHSDNEKHHDHDAHDEHDDHDEHEQNHHDSHDDHEEHSEFLSDGDKPWGTVIGMSLVVNLTTLTGIFLIGGHWGRNLFCGSKKFDPAVGKLWANVIIPMFACGALMATTFFLLLPESLHLIASEYGGDGHDHRRLEGDDEVASTWRWGSAIMGGFLIPVVLHAFFPHAEMHGHHTAASMVAPATIAHAVAEMENEQAAAVTTVEAGDTEKPVSDKTGDSCSDLACDEADYKTYCGCLRLKNMPLFLSFNLAEALHNFTDGVFIGAAYVGCGNSVGNSVVLATMLHELPNQLAGYLIMVNQNGINPVVALLLNFLFGLSTLLGGLVILVSDLGNLAVGCIFAVGGGIFLHVAISEMLCLAESNVRSIRHIAYMFLSFLFGAVCIGLVLINHEHCGGH